MKCTLVVESDPMDLKSFEFDQETITIGRIMGNDLVINDMSVSRYHAKIIGKDGEFELFDLDSKNGVKHNGSQVKSAKLNDQDRIDIGNVTLKFFCAALSMESASEETVIARPSGIKGVKIDRLVKDSAERVKGLLKKEGKKEEGPSGQAEGAPPAGIQEKVLILLKKPLVLAAFGVLLLLVVIVSFSGEDAVTREWGQLKNVPDNSNVPIPLPASGVYGHGKKGNDKTHVDKALFTFSWQKGKALLNYYIAGVGKGEVDIVLNDHKIGSAPAFNGWLNVKNVRLPEEYLRKGENRLVFDNVINPPGSLPGPGGSETWGVSDVNVKIEDYPACDQALAEENYNRAVMKYKEKKISYRNLYDAVENYRKAVDYFMVCDPRPPMFDESRKGLMTTEQELDSEYEARMLAAQQAANSQDWDRVKREMEDVLKIIPDPDDYRYVKADSNLVSLGLK